MAKYPRYGEAWANCGTCGRSVPISRIRMHPRWGWQCIGPTPQACWDGGPDHDQQVAMKRYRVAEGTRKTSAPKTNTSTEGI
jgi:hypothetical protein